MSKKKAPGLACEALEGRANPSSYVDGYGNLVVLGTDAADSVTVHYEPASSTPYYYMPARLKVYENGSHTASHYTWNVTGRIEFYGYGGNDYFNNYAGGWAVAAYGHGGNDTLIGDAQADRLEGGAGDDALYGYWGDDLVVGQDGNDRVYGMDGNDTVIGCWYGWAGEAGGADDVVDGGAGNDGVYGGDGNDNLYGGPGADYLRGDGGADLMDGGDGFDRYHDDFNLANPIYVGQRAEDVVQGAAPTCQTLAVLAAASDVGHDFSRQLTNLGNNAWRVRVFPNGVATDYTVTFDGSWSDTDPRPGRDASGRNLPEFWTVLFQRARLMTFGVADNNEMTADRWNSLNAAFGQRPQNASDAIRTLTGRAAAHTAIGGVTFEALTQSLLRRDVMTAYTPATLPAGSPLVAAHVYSIRDVYVDSPTNTRMVRLYNPWGFEQRITWDAFRANFQGVEIG